MAKERTAKGGGAKLSRSETVTVRLDPKLRYLAELGARSQRRTVSSFIENPLSSTPVPRPTISFGLMPVTTLPMAAEGVVLAIPMSPVPNNSIPL